MGWRGAERCGVVQGWCGAVWHGTARRVVVRCGVVWSGVARRGVALCYDVRYGAVLCGMVWCVGCGPDECGPTGNGMCTPDAGACSCCW